MDEPTSLEEALGMNDEESWKVIIDDEMVALKRNDAWDLVPFLEG